MVKFGLHFYEVKIFQVEILKALKASSEGIFIGQGENFVYRKKILEKWLFYKKDLCTVKERWIIILL